MKIYGVIFLMIFAVFLMLPFAAFAQEAEEVPGADPWSYIALGFNSGIVLMLVQLLKNLALPGLKKNYPYLIPLIGMGIGIASAWVLQATGIDISPIGDLFGAGIISGALASAQFAVIKEGHNEFQRRGVGV